MNYDKSLVPHFAFPPTLLADGFLLAGCHYKALQGERHCDMGTHYRGTAQRFQHPRKLSRVLDALPCSHPRSDTRRVMPLTKRGGRNAGNLFVHQNNILLGSLHNSNSQPQRGLRRAVPPPPPPQGRSRGGWMALEVEECKTAHERDFVFSFSSIHTGLNKSRALHSGSLPLKIDYILENI